jgi:hypothetical protein
MCRLEYVWAHNDKGRLEAPDCVRQHDEERRSWTTTPRPCTRFAASPSCRRHGISSVQPGPHVSCSVARRCRCEKYEVSISEYKNIQMSCGRGRDVHYHTKLCNGEAAQTIPYERSSSFRDTADRAQCTKETTKLLQIFQCGGHESKLC